MSAPTIRPPGEATAGPRIHVGLTTIPPRMPNILRCIESLVAQSLPPERIFISVPRRYRRFGEPASLPFDPARFGGRVEVIEAPEDFGPGTKLLGSIDRARGDGADLLVLVDDDLIYQPHMIATFAEAFQADPGAAASFYTYRYHGLRVGQGADGFALPVSRLDGLWDYHAAIRDSEAAFFVDDLWVSWFLRMKSIPIRDLSAKAGPNGHVFHIYNDTEALSRADGELRRKRVMRRALWDLRERVSRWAPLWRACRRLLPDRP